MGKIHLAAGGGRRWVVLLAVGWLAQLALRLWLASQQTLPVANPDETGYLFGARVLTGGPDADLSGITFYQAGYSLLIAPAYWFGDDPLTVYRLVILINSLVSAALLVLAYLALRRLGLSRGRAYVLGNLTALLPAVVFYSQFALTDAVLPVVVLGWLLLLHSWLMGGGAGYGAAASGLAIFAYAMHSRGQIILLVQVAIVAVAVLSATRLAGPLRLGERWAGRGDLLLTGGALIAVVPAVWLNGWLRSHTYPDGIKPLGDWLTDRLTSWDGLAWTFSLAAGQIWYLLVSTWGVAGIGLAALAAVAVRRGGVRATRVTAVAVLVTIAGIAVATSAALPDEHRVGNFVYGRYLACFAPVLFLAGAAVAVRAPRATLVRAAAVALGLIAATGGVAWAYAGSRLTGHTFVQFDFPEISALTGTWTQLKLWPATVTASCLLLLLIALLPAPVPRWYGPLLAPLVLGAVNVGSVVQITEHISRPLVERMKTTELAGPAGLRGTERVAMDRHLALRVRLSQTFQVIGSEVHRFDRRLRAPLPRGVSLVLVPWRKGLRATATWPKAPDGWRPITAQRSRLGDWVAWRHTGVVAGRPVNR